MSIDEFRTRMTEFRNASNEEADQFKDSYLALERLQVLYENFSTEDRTTANRVIGEWVLSGDENLRFDAIALIDKFGIIDTLSELQELALRLLSSKAPSAPFELEKVNRLISRLIG